MDQDRIWDHFQNEGIERFDDARGRYKAIAGEVQRRHAGTGRVLNIGIGAGGVETRLQAAGWQVASLDPDAKAVARMGSQGANARQGYAQAIPFADRSFDVVVASEVLEHIDAGTRPRVYREIERVLDEGGWLVGSVPYRERLLDSEAVCPKCGHVFHRWGHVSSFDKAALSGELATVFSMQSCRKLAFVDWQGCDSIGRYLKETARWILGRTTDGIVYQSLVFAARRKKPSVPPPP